MFFSPRYPKSALTVSASQGPQTIHSKAVENNLRLLSWFLTRIPFPLKVTSGYRSPGANRAIEGSGTSQHPNGLAVDVVPLHMPNWMLGTWLYQHRMLFPELDQVITYADGRGHLHIGICPPSATNCPSRLPRRQFLVYNGSDYNTWLPSLSGIPVGILQTQPWSPRNPYIIPAIGLGSLLVGGALYWRYREEINRLLP